MAGVKKAAPHQILANSIQSWAQENDLLTDPYIAGLSNAVSNRKNLPMWASLNPAELDTKIAQLPAGSRYLVKHSVSNIKVLIKEIIESSKYSV